MCGKWYFFVEGILKTQYNIVTLRNKKGDYIISLSKNKETKYFYLKCVRSILPFYFTILTAVKI